ncbi:MAG: DUF2147 domain-containing protein [Bacteroides sp.]|nr:DUF2147 domain-containing protein [Bacteroides sp.]
MKKQLLLMAVAMLISLPIFAQADAILGIWLTEEGTSQIEITKASNGQFVGKIVWLDEPLDENGRPKLDKENPKANLKNQRLLGLQILKGFSYDAGDKEWTGGTIYDPDNGKTYTAFMKLDGNNKLVLRGYVMGMRMLGRNSFWTRERAIRQ